MRIISQKTIFDGSESALSSQTFPWVCESPSGRIFVMFRGGPYKGPTNTAENGWYLWSDDGGKTFTLPRAPYGEVTLGDGTKGWLRSFQLLPLGGKRIFLVGTLVAFEDRSLPYYNEETEGLKDSRLVASFSDDDGVSFGPLSEIPMTAQFAGLSTVLTGPPLLLSDGRVMVNFEVYKQYDDPRPIDHKAGCIFSADDGKTFGQEVTIYNSPDLYAWDHRAAEGAPGHLLDFVWTFDRHTNNYRNLGRIESTDGGQTWGELAETPLSGQAGNAVMLPDGRLALVYMDRTGAPTVRLAVSYDLGKTFPEILDLYIHGSRKAEHTKSQYNEAWTEMGKYTAGHSFLTLLANGQLLIVNYAGPEKDRTDLMLTWVEA